MLDALSPKLRGTVNATLVALRSLPTAPSMARIGGLLPVSAGAESAGRNRLKLLLGGMVGVLVLCALGLLAVASWRPAAAPRSSNALDGMALRLTPPDPLRRVRSVGEQLNLATRTINDQIFFYASTADDVQTALALAGSEATGGTRPHVVSLLRLASLVAGVFRDNGFTVTDETAAADGPAVALTIQVPASLRPWHDALVAQVKKALAAVPALSPVRLRETVKEDGASFLLATMVGKPASRAFTAEGAKEVGDDVLGRFKLRSVKADHVEIARSAGAQGQVVSLSIPLHGDSRLASGNIDVVTPADFTSAILD